MTSLFPRKTILAVAATATLAGLALAGCSSMGDTGSTGVGTASSTASPTASPTATATPTPTAGPSASCGPSNGTDAASKVIASLALPAGLNESTWDATNADYAGYSPCAALSWSVVTLVGSTPSSPYAVLLFHRGKYLGTATAVQYPFSPEITRTSDGAIAVTYRYAKADDANANPMGRTAATFTWNAATHTVDMTGGTPPTD